MEEGSWVAVKPFEYHGFWWRITGEDQRHLGVCFTLWRASGRKEVGHIVAGHQFDGNVDYRPEESFGERCRKVIQKLVDYAKSSAHEELRRERDKMISAARQVTV